jgi:hypothetical protein
MNKYEYQAENIIKEIWMMSDMCKREIIAKHLKAQYDKGNKNRK